MLVPLFPLASVVHFPDTLLPLHIFEARYRRLVADLLELPESERRIGMIFAALAPGGEEVELVEPGCAGRLIEHVPLADGRSNIVLAGEFRFRVDREIAHQPYRVAEVSALSERLPLVDHERISACQQELLALTAAVVERSGERSPIDLAELAGLGAEGRLAALANRIAARLDVPPPRKQSLLAMPPLERAEEIAGILRSRVTVLDCLAPYRSPSADPALN